MSSLITYIKNFYHLVRLILPRTHFRVTLVLIGLGGAILTNSIGWAIAEVIAKEQYDTTLSNVHPLFGILVIIIALIYSYLMYSKEIKYMNNSEELANKWRAIFNELTNGSPIINFTSTLTVNYEGRILLSAKFLDILPDLLAGSGYTDKARRMVTKLLEKEKIIFTYEFINKLKGDEWRSYHNHDFLNHLSGNLNLYFQRGYRNLIKNITDSYQSDWEKENDGSEVLDLFIDKLNNRSKVFLARQYVDIYLDSFRDSPRPQKRFAEKIFNLLISQGKEPVQVLKQQIIQFLRTEKGYYLRQGRTISQDDKEMIISGAKSKFKRLFSTPEIADNTINKLYKKA